MHIVRDACRRLNQSFFQEGHDLAVEGAIDEIIVRITGLEAKLVKVDDNSPHSAADSGQAILNIFGK